MGSVCVSDINGSFLFHSYCMYGLNLLQISASKGDSPFPPSSPPLPCMLQPLLVQGEAGREIRGRKKVKKNVKKIELLVKFMNCCVAMKMTNSYSVRIVNVKRGKVAGSLIRL